MSLPLNLKTKAAFATAIANEKTEYGKRRIARLRDRLATGKLDKTDMIIGMCDLMLGVKPPRN